jgi:hypothetical protein
MVLPITEILGPASGGTEGVPLLVYEVLLLVGVGVLTCVKIPLTRPSADVHPLPKGEEIVFKIKGTPRRAPTIRFAIGVLFVAILAAISMPGCGGSATSGGSGANGTPAGTYTLAVKGTLTSGAATTSHNINLKLTVQ